MQRNDQEVVDLSITPSMKKSEIKRQIEAAERYAASHHQLSSIKLHVLSMCIGYAKGSLHSVFTKEHNRYGIYSNIMNAADVFANNDDLHFLAFVVKELSQINTYENSSFRKSVLPAASRYLAIMLAPEIARTQKAFMGLAVASMAMFLAQPRAAAFITPIALAAIFFSENIVYARLYRSLELKLHRAITAGNGEHAAIADGLQDEVGRFMTTATGMLDSGLTLFSSAGNHMQRLAHLSNNLQQGPRIEELPNNAHAENAAQPNRIEMPEYHVPPAASAPPAHEVEDFIQEPRRRHAFN